MAKKNTQVKNLELPLDTIKALKIQAINKNFDSFKSYAEHVLIQQGNVK